MYIYSYTLTHARTHTRTYAQLHHVRIILFKGGEPSEECVFLVRVTPSGTMVSHVPRLPNNKITAAMFAQDQRSRWECVCVCVCVCVCARACVCGCVCVENLNEKRYEHAKRLYFTLYTFYTLLLITKTIVTL